MPPKSRLVLEDLEDLVAGALAGVFIGDAIGAPHEFRHGPPYVDGATHPLTVVSQYIPKRTGVVGQVTDDTEMTWALARSIIEADGYLASVATQAYLKWANGLDAGMARVYPLPPSMGKNTRRLFQGVKTIKGYLARKERAPATESNGCLMRAIPLFFFSEADLETDVRLTNDCDVAVAACLAARRIYWGLVASKETVASTTEALGKGLGLDEEVDRAIHAGRGEEPWDLKTSKGWVVHPIYVLSLVVTKYGATVQAMRETLYYLNYVSRGCDSDTLGAIVLGIIGGVVGRQRLLRSPFFARWYQTILLADTTLGELPRPVRYQPSAKGLGVDGMTFDDLVEGVVAVATTPSVGKRSASDTSG